MLVDERLINVYGADNLAKQLNNTELLLGLVVSRFNRNNLNSNPKANHLASIDAFDNYIAKMLMTNPHGLDRNKIIAYRDRLFELFKSNPKIAYDSILFRKGLANKLFTTSQFNEIASYKIEMATSVHKRFINLIKNPGNTIDDDIIRYATYNIENDNPKVINMLDNLFRYLLENKKNNASLIAREFILRYTSHLAAKNLGVPSCNVYITNDKLGGQKFSRSNLGTSYGNSGIITINRDSLINNVTYSTNIPASVQYMMVVCHETKHSEQSLKASKHAVSKVGFEMQKNEIFSKYLSDKDYNEYHSNYLHSEIEADANDYGWYYTYKIFSKYLPNEAQLLDELISKRIKNDYQELTATKINRNSNKHIEAWEYNVSKTDEIIKAHPELTIKYPLLKMMYGDNCEIKSLMELIREEKRHNGNEEDEVEKIFSDYYTYHVSKGALTKIDANGLSEEDAFLLFAKLTDMLLEEYRKLNNSFKIFKKYESKDEYRQREFLFANSGRVSRINQLIAYMNSNNELINKLASIDTNRDGNVRAFGMRLGYIDRMHQNLTYYLTKINDFGITDENFIIELETLRDNAYDSSGRGSR